MRAVSALFWIIVWIISARVINNHLLLPGPGDVVVRFFSLITTADFLYAAFVTVTRILLGFFTALILAIILAVISNAFKPIKVIILPFMTALKSVPVASFVILAILWFNTEFLSSFIAFVMVLPVIYVNMIYGIDSCEKEMLEMAKVFKVSPLKKAAYIYTPYVIPFFKSGCSVALGLCWKAGIAAELIGVPDNTIGERLYFSKIYFEMTDLFACTVMIILISLIFEKLFIYLLSKLIELYERT